MCGPDFIPRFYFVAGVIVGVVVVVGGGVDGVDVVGGVDGDGVGVVGVGVAGVGVVVDGGFGVGVAGDVVVAGAVDRAVGGVAARGAIKGMPDVGVEPDAVWLLLKAFVARRWLLGLVRLLAVSNFAPHG